MSQNTEEKEISAVKASKNDWGDLDGDDDWDDWGSAEDTSFPDELAKNEIENKTRKPTDTHMNQHFKKTDQTSTQKTITEDTISHQQQQTTATSSWWGGLTSVLSTATEGLGSITSTVSQGLNQVIGVPEPEELAQLNANEAAKVQKSEDSALTTRANSVEESNDDSAAAFGKHIVSGVTTLGSRVLNTGLDTLEGIGKKTMHILQDNDPMLKNKRKLLGLEPERPNLSDVLKAAKKDAEEVENTLKELKIAQNHQLMHFEPLFEQKCGLVHLEALEILSRESELKLQSLVDSVSGKALQDLQETINEVKELMELEEFEADSEGDYTTEDLNSKLLAALEDLDLPLHFDDLVSNWQQALDWLDNRETSDAQAIYEQGISTLAECCALEMNKLHKIAELLLVKEHHSTASEVDGVVELCHHFKVHLHGVTHRFAAQLTALTDDEAKNQLNRLCGELLLALQQIDMALKLFLPIIQIGAA